MWEKRQGYRKGVPSAKQHPGGNRQGSDKVEIAVQIAKRKRKTGQSGVREKNGLGM